MARDDARVNQAVTVLLHRVEGPVNLGAICRVMANLDFDRLRFSGGLRVDDPMASRFAVHAGDLLAGAGHCATIETLTAGLHTVYGFTPRNPVEDGRGLDVDGFLDRFEDDVAAGRRIGLLFGNEAHGLDNNELAHCHYRVRLPTSEAYESMNLAMAVGVVLWELHRKFGSTSIALAEPVPEMAEPEEIGHLIENLRGYVDTFELLNPQNDEHIWRELTALFKTRRWRKRELQLLHVLLSKPRSRYGSLLRRLGDAGDD